MYTYLDKPILVLLSKVISPTQNGDGDVKGADQQRQQQPRVSGILRGFDMYNNLVLENAVDESQPGVKTEMSEIVRRCSNEGQ